MAVVYATGATSSPTDFITKLAAFANANSFPANAVTGGWVFHKGGINVGVRINGNNIEMKGATGYNGAAAWNAQPNSSAITAIINCLTAGPFTAYHFWTGDEGGVEYIHAIVELTDGKYRHLAIGQLVTLGTITGAMYVEGVNWAQSVSFIDSPDNSQHFVICDANSGSAANHMLIDYDSKVNNFQGIYNLGNHLTTKCAGDFRSVGMSAPLVSCEEMKWNLRTALYPLEYYAGRASGAWSRIGRLPNTRGVNMRAIGPEDEIEVGGETWKCFPIVQRQDAGAPANVENSSYYGYALLMP
jgi:hypothetical protein